MNKKKYLLINRIGRIGKIHLKNLFNHFKSIKIEAISDTNEKLEKLCKTYNIGKFYKSYQDLIKDKSIDAVLICSPTSSSFKTNHICCET